MPFPLAFDEAIAIPHAAGVIHVAPNGHVLLLRRATTEENYPDYWGLPGGGAEPDETPEMTASREAREEIGDGHYEDGEMSLLDQVTTPTGAQFYTYAKPVQIEFAPTLNREHSEYGWFAPDALPEPVHPGVLQTINSKLNTSVADCAEVIAMDRETVRTRDADGHLHVSRTPISKANVCPYYGHEIPNSEQLGLEPNRIYQMLRDPAELERAAGTFARKPLLLLHKASTAEEHPRAMTVGTVGDDVRWEAPYLTAPLTVWDGEAIMLIDTSEQRQLSASYRYIADMTPGVHEGVRHDGVMRGISGNHVALVKEGRAGADVIVGDEKLKTGGRVTFDAQPTPKEKVIMSKFKMSRMGLATAGALVAYLTPKLAQDAQIDVTGAVKDLTFKNFAEKQLGVVTAITKLVEGKLAKDADITDLAELLNALSGSPMGEAIEEEVDKDGNGELSDEEKAAAAAAAGGDGEGEMDGGENVKEKVLALLKGKLSDDDLAAIASCFDGGTANDDDPDKEKEDMVDKKAMDAAIEAVKKDTIAEMRATQAAIKIAEKDVKPYVGELAVAYDSADGVYRAALSALGVKDTDKLHSDALRPILLAQPVPGVTRHAVPHVAMDAAAADSFTKMFPGAGAVRVL